MAAGMLMAFRLADYPLAAILTLAVIMTVTYLLLNRFVRIEPPTVRREIHEVAVESPADVDTLHDEEWEDWRTHASSVPPDLKPLEAEPADSGAEEPDLGVYAAPEGPAGVDVETLRVGDRRITIGDPASYVMSAFTPGTGEVRPLVERLEGGEAGRVTRTYAVGSRTVVLEFARFTSGEPLRLERIELK